MELTFLQYILIALSILFTISYVVSKRQPNIPEGLKPLPGPPGRPLLGNTGQFDPLAPVFTFAKWAREYGPIFQIKLGSQVYISVNDPVIAKELFEKRGNLYNSRISTHVGSDLLSEGRRITFTPHGAKHNTFRKQIHNILSVSKTRDNQLYQELESRQILRDLLDVGAQGSKAAGESKNVDDWERFELIFRRYTASIMMTLTFGHRIKTLTDDHLVETIFKIMSVFGDAIQPGGFFVDTFPFLKRLPKPLRTWETWVDRELAWQWPFMEGLLRQVENQKRRHVPNNGLIRMLVDQREGMDEQERLDKFLDDKSIGFQSMTMMEAGADTTAITMMNFNLAMLLHPDAQRKGQACVDAVVGEDRLPTFEDMPNLQYVNQIVKEVMRWRPVITLGIPHANTAADSYDGYYIPKDSIVYGNIWNMHHDSSHYANADDFVPERYDGFTKSAFEYSQVNDAMNRDHYVFGWVGVLGALSLRTKFTDCIAGSSHLCGHAPS